MKMFSLLLQRETPMQRFLRFLGTQGVATFIPFDRLLPKVSVFVTNGGYGAVNQALAAGVPVITAGETEDKGWVSQRVAWSGAGINLETSRPTERQIRSAVLEARSKSSYRRTA